MDGGNTWQDLVTPELSTYGKHGLPGISPEARSASLLFSVHSPTAELCSPGSGGECESEDDSKPADWSQPSLRDASAD